jgi:hypothetical protein
VIIYEVINSKNYHGLDQCVLDLHVQRKLWGTCQDEGSDSVGLSGTGFFISKQFLDEASGPWIILEQSSPDSK